MKLSRQQLRRLIRESQREINIEPQTDEEKIRDLMSNPMGDPERPGGPDTFLSGFEIGMALDIIKVLDRVSWKNDKGRSFVQYTVTMPDKIRMGFEGVAHHTEGIVHPFRIILMRYPYMKIILNR